MNFFKCCSFYFILLLYSRNHPNHQPPNNWSTNPQEHTIHTFLLMKRKHMNYILVDSLQDNEFPSMNYKISIYYQLIISIIRSKRQKSDCVDSVQIRKGEDLTYLTFCYIKITQIWIGWSRLNRLHNMIKPKQRRPCKGVNDQQPFHMLLPP